VATWPHGYHIAEKFGEVLIWRFSGLGKKLPILNLNPVALAGFPRTGYVMHCTSTLKNRPAYIRDIGGFFSLRGKEIPFTNEIL